MTTPSSLVMLPPLGCVKGFGLHGDPFHHNDGCEATRRICGETAGSASQTTGGATLAVAGRGRADVSGDPDPRLHHNSPAWIVHPAMLRVKLVESESPWILSVEPGATTIGGSNLKLSVSGISPP